MVYQEMLCFPNLSVTGNIFAGRELVGAGGRLRDAEMRSAHGRDPRRAAPAHPAASAPAESLPAAHRQLLQVARALAFDCRILVLDEPTTALTDAEADHLFAVLEKLKARGVTLLYVSHRLPEVFRLCDRITVLRDGSYAGTFDTARGRRRTTSCGRWSGAICRRAPSMPRGQRAQRRRWRSADLTRRPAFRDVSLTVAPGEIVGLFGLVGSGRSELLETIFGLHHAAGRHDRRRRDSRSRRSSPRQAARAGRRAGARGAAPAGAVLQPDAPRTT